MKCKNCFYWEKFDPKHLDPLDWKGQCRRYPRKGIQFSAADPNDWCGEFKADPRKPCK